MKTSPYPYAQEAYADLGVDTEAVLQRLPTIPLSLHCWQGDDVGGFETTGAALSGGGIQATGNYPGKARTHSELRQDLDKALSLLPGKHRLNLHASYADFDGKKVERDQVTSAHFQSWIDWAKKRGMGLDFNPTYFSHPLGNDGATLSHRDPAVRQFWIDHGIACRKIGAEMGRQLGSTTVTNVWIPDGGKDVPVDRKGPRERLEASLDAIFQEPLDPKIHLDAVESKLFGIGSESYVVGSHEFYLGYAIKRQKVYCLDAGLFIPRKILPTRFPRFCSTCRKSCCTSVAACGGTATTSSCSTIRHGASWRSWCVEITSRARTSASIILTRALTASRRGSSAPVRR